NFFLNDVMIFLFFAIQCFRNHLLSFHQNITKHALKRLKATIFPPKPKKPESPFLLYVRHVKPQFIKEEPDMKYSEILQRASNEWAKLDFVEKQNFRVEFDKNYKIYTEKLREYDDSVTEEQKQLWKQKKKEYEKADIKKKYEVLGKPKKPLNAYLFYLWSKRKDKDPDIPTQDWIKSVSVSWKALSDEEKEPYITEAMQHNAQYSKDLKKWEMEMIRSGNFDIVRNKTLLEYKNANFEE
ncbi:unnamed protein product, partial [Heterotrigona itama]